MFRRMLPRRKASPDAGWVGVHAAVGRITAALVHGGTDKQQPPRIGACVMFEGPCAADDLIRWHQGHREASRTASSVLLDPADYQILTLDVPAVPRAERRDAVRWRLKDMLDFPANEAALDCVDVPAVTAGDEPTKLLAVVSSQTTVARWMRRYHDSGLTLAAIDVPEMALRNVALLAGGDSAHAFLHIGLEATHLILLWQGELCTFRQLDINAPQLAAAGDEDKQPLLERLALEVQRTADAFARQFNTADLSGLWVSSLTGTDALVEALGPMVNLRIHAFHIERQVNLEGVAHATDLARRIDYTLAIGAALRGPSS